MFSLILELMSRSLRPTVIVIEDIHWADEATLDLIKFLGGESAGAMACWCSPIGMGRCRAIAHLRVALADIAASVLERIL